MCVLVILDAAIVLSEILIDLHAMRSQLMSSYDRIYRRYRSLVGSVVNPSRVASPNPLHMGELTSQ